MQDFSSSDGIIIALAYPEEMVSMIPAWYGKPLEWIGLVKNGKICAGHAAMMLLHKQTKEIHYADFGRYITPFGYGRTRTKITDPDVAFDFDFEIDENGQISNKDEVLFHIYNSPKKTHGGPVMYASFHEGIDYRACRDFIDNMNAKGSIIYDPFKKNASNCSRFVFDSILAGMKTKKEKQKLIRKSVLTPSPLGNVFHGSTSDSFVINDGKLDVATNKNLMTVIKHLYKHTSPEVPEPKYKPLPEMQKLTGVGDESYYRITDLDQSNLGIYRMSRTTIHGEEIYDHHFKVDDNSFDHQKEFTYIHDCNAKWMSVEQNGKKYRFDRV